MAFRAYWVAVGKMLLNMLSSDRRKYFINSGWMIFH